MMTNDIKDIWIDLYDELFGFVLSKVKEEAIAEDIIQEVFIKVQSNIDQLSQASKLTSWIYQISRNTIIDYYRKKVHNTTSIDDLDIPEEDVDSFEYAKLTGCITGKIEKLSSQYREAIVLTYLKDFSQKQLASQLNISYSGAKSRVQKARNILKENILDCPNIEADRTGKIIDFDKKTD